MFNVLFTSSLCSPGGRLGWLYLTFFFSIFPTLNLVHAYYLCLMGLSADFRTPLELPMPKYFLLSSSWANTLWSRKHGSMSPQFWGGRSCSLYAFTCSVLYLPWSLFDQKQKAEKMVYYKNYVPLVSSDTNAKSSFQVLFCSFVKEENGVMF